MAASTDAVTEIAINDWIDIGGLGKDEEELYLQKHKINQPEMAFEIIVHELPVEDGIDPYMKRTDGNPVDNTTKLEKPQSVKRRA